MPSSSAAPGDDASENPDVDLEPAAAYAHSILKTLADVLAAKVELGHPDVVKYVDRLVPRLYNLFIYSALAAEERPMVATDPRLLAVTAQIVTLVTQTLSAAYVHFRRQTGGRALIQSTGDKRLSSRPSLLRMWMGMCLSLPKESRKFPLTRSSARWRSVATSLRS